MKMFLVALILYLFSGGGVVSMSVPHRRVATDLSSSADRERIKKIVSESHAVEKKFPDSAIRLVRGGLMLAKQLHYKFGEALMLSRFSQINLHYDNFDMALKYQQEAVVLFKQLSLSSYIAKGNADLGIVYGKMKQLNKGISCLNLALTFYKQSDDISDQFETIMAMGHIAAVNGAKNQALNYNIIAKALMRDQKKTDAYFKLISHTGTLYEKAGRYEEALKEYETGIEGSSRAKSDKWHAVLLRHAGSLWDKLGNTKKALAFHQSSISSAEKSAMPEEEVRSRITLAMSQKNEDIVQSIAHLKIAMDIAKSIGNRLLIAEILQSLSGLYRQQSNFQQALDLFEQHHKIIDSLEKANTGRKLALLQGSYEIADNQLHIEQLELSNRKRSDERDAGIFISVATLLILAVLLFYYLRMRKLNAELKSANTIKDKLFSIIGHDLKNPISGIAQLAAIMDEQELNSAEGKEMLSMLRKQTDVSLSILNELLDWGRTQINGVAAQDVIFAPRLYIDKTMQLILTQSTAKQLKFEVNVSEALQLKGDVNHFEFIIRNLLSNAVKFSFPGGTIEIYAIVRSDRSVVFAVRDYGKGISAEQQLQFTKTNLDVSFGTEGEKGTGIGLVLSKEFIKAAGGKIWIKSEVGKGATFLFYFGTSQSDQDDKQVPDLGFFK